MFFRSALLVVMALRWDPMPKSPPHPRLLLSTVPVPDMPRRQCRCCWLPVRRLVLQLLPGSHVTHLGTALPDSRGAFVTPLRGQRHSLMTLDVVRVLHKVPGWRTRQRQARLRLRLLLMLEINISALLSEVVARVKALRPRMMIQPWASRRNSLRALLFEVSR